LQIITNPGANLPPELVGRYQLTLTSSTVVVDGQEHDCRDDVSLADIDRWVDTAEEHPYVLGTSAAEFAREYTELAKHDAEVLVVMSSRKIIQSYDAALSAAKTLQGRIVGRSPSVRVVDTAMTDLGLGLSVIAAAEAARAGLGLHQVAEAVESFAARARFALIPRTLDNLIKGGRASFLRGWVAKMFGLRPIIAFVDGEAQAVGKCSADADHPTVLADWLRTNVQGDAVWIGVTHGDADDDAQALAARLHELFDVRYALVRRTSPSVYLHAGPGALGAVVIPLHGLAWVPPTPAPL
jgi:DegV family protein with EDD domain